VKNWIERASQEEERVHWQEVALIVIDKGRHLCHWRPVAFAKVIALTVNCVAQGQSPCGLLYS